MNNTKKNGVQTKYLKSKAVSNVTSANEKTKTYYCGDRRIGFDMNKDIGKLFVGEDTSIKDVMRKITEAVRAGLPPGIAVVVDQGNRLRGVVTDGDIRRALVKGIEIEEKVSGIMIVDPITVSHGLSTSKMIEVMREKVMTTSRLRDSKVDQIVVVDDDNHVVDILSFLDLWMQHDFRTRNVCVVGLGFVGLTLAVTFADLGFQVYGYDVDEQLLRSLEAGKPHFYEKGLEPLLRYHLEKGSLRLARDLSDIRTDIYIVAVGTPLDERKRSVMTFIESAAMLIGKRLKARDCVFLRSTVPVGTTRDVVLPILEKCSGLRGGKEFMIAFAPERTIEGKALDELRRLPQIVGGINEHSTEAAANFFSNMTKTIIRLPNLEEGEMVKLINNSFRDLSFAFANEVSLICDKLGLDAERVIEGANRGYNRNPVPKSSPGVGGVCLKKDPYIFSEVAHRAGISMCLALTGRKTNECIPERLVRKIKKFLEDNHGSGSDFKLFIIGFAFKGEPETSDMRDSVTLDFLQLLHLPGLRIFGFDPMVPADEIKALRVSPVSVEEGFCGADCVVFMNNHRSYGNLDLIRLLKSMNTPGLVVDGWRQFQQADVERVDGITYEALGVCRNGPGANIAFGNV
jgi:nucleotide sugar dehydrogenase